MSIHRISGYPEYAVTSGGHVMSMRFGKLRVLKPATSRKGYQLVALWKEKRQKTFPIHRLVLETFCRPRQGHEVCMHLDGNPTNNSLYNLRWGTPKENSQQMVKDGNGPKSRFTKEEFELMRILPGTNAEVARLFGVDPSYISHIRAGRKGRAR